MNKSSASGEAKVSAPKFFSKDVAEARRFYLELNPPKSRQLVVVCGGLEHCKPDFAIHRQTFPYYSIEYVTHGRGEVKLNGHTTLLQPGRLFSYGPGVSQHITCQSSNPLVKYFLDFVGTHALELLHSCDLPPGGITEAFPVNTLQPLFEEIIQAGLRGNGKNVVLCSKLLECLALRISGSHAPIEARETHAFATYQHCRQHIEQHNRQLRTLEQVATECHVNKAYLCRLFRRYDNQSPYQYLLRLKMNFAADRLLQPDSLVKQVAEETGFDDQFHFSRVFSSVFGLSPTAFRGMRHVAAEVHFVRR